ncbi:MAG: ATP-dependent DNA helicase RecG [Chloroflexota bacterium]
MSSAYDKLRRILLLERTQGYHDRAVMGGLAEFLQYWQNQARREGEQASLGDPVTVGRVLEILDGYGELSPTERSDRVATLLEALQEGGQSSEDIASPDDGSTEGEEATPSGDEVTKKAEGASEDKASTDGPPRDMEAALEAQKTLYADVTAIKGIGDVISEHLARLDIETVEDLLYHLPRRYDDFGELKSINRLEYGEEVTIVAVIKEIEARRTRSGKSLVQVTLGDATGSIQATWFNQPYLRRQFDVGDEMVISGEVDEYLGRLVFTSPEWEPLQRELLHTGRLVPVYPLTEGVSARQFRRLVRNTLDAYVSPLLDPLPRSIVKRHSFLRLDQALEQIHFPKSRDALHDAHRRLCFDEFLLLQLGILRQRQAWRSQQGRILEIPEGEIEAFIEGLPFSLTEAQERAIEEILGDLQRPIPMSRLLEGDVGSGKTVVAVVAILAAVRNGLQTAVMAPTSVLAEQHYRTILDMLEGLEGISCALLVGSLSAAEKERIQQKVAQGRIQVVVGTHALIQETVDFARLGLVVIDEQHRFGVRQRKALRDKGGEVKPHLLAMSATPIPRTLALTVYGDLDISVIDELPPTRQEVITAVRDNRSRERIYSFIRAQVSEGHQAFIICPLVEASDKMDGRAAVEEYERLQEDVFPDLQVGLLHGRMSADEKDQVMAAFRDGEYDILVSTAVVEVGIDVPNATVMLVEGAERFGLAQLHQFRGRVGRGEHKSYAILMSDESSEESVERLRIMEETNDGFVLAEKDLEMRGPGDFFGSRQHGLPPLKVARLSDTATLERARQEAKRLFQEDPDLGGEAYRLLRAKLERFWSTISLS